MGLGFRGLGVGGLGKLAQLRPATPRLNPTLFDGVFATQTLV